MSDEAASELDDLLASVKEEAIRPVPMSSELTDLVTKPRPTLGRKIGTAVVLVGAKSIIGITAAAAAVGLGAHASGVIDIPALPAMERFQFVDADEPNEADQPDQPDTPASDDANRATGCPSR